MLGIPATVTQVCLLAVGYYTGETLRVLRRDDGSVSHLDLATFRFTRTPYDPEADVPGGVDEQGWR